MTSTAMSQNSDDTETIPEHLFQSVKGTVKREEASIVVKFSDIISSQFSAQLDSKSLSNRLPGFVATVSFACLVGGIVGISWSIFLARHGQYSDAIIHLVGATGFVAFFVLSVLIYRRMTDSTPTNK